MPSLTTDVEFIACVSPNTTVKNVEVVDLFVSPEKSEIVEKDEEKCHKSNPISFNNRNCIRVSIEKGRLGKGNQFENAQSKGQSEISDVFVSCKQASQEGKKFYDEIDFIEPKNCITNEVSDVLLHELHDLPVNSFPEQEPGSQSGDRVTPSGSCEDLPTSPHQSPSESGSERPTTRSLFMPNLVPSRSRHSSETSSPNINKHGLDASDKSSGNPAKRAKRSRSASSNTDCQDNSVRRKSFSGGGGSNCSPGKSFGDIINHQLKNINLKDMVNKPNFNRKAELVMQHLMKEHNQSINRQLRILAEARMLGKQQPSSVEDSCGSLTLQDPLEIDPDLAVDLAALPPEFIENLQNLFDLDIGVPDGNTVVPTGDVNPPTDLESDLNTGDVSDMFSSSILAEIVEPESLLMIEHVEKCIEQGTIGPSDHEDVVLNDSKIDDLNLQGNLEYVERKIESLKQEIKSYEESDATIKNGDKLGDAIDVKEEIFHIPDMPDNMEFINDPDVSENQDTKDFVTEFSVDQKQDALFLAASEVCSTMHEVNCVERNSEILQTQSDVTETLINDGSKEACDVDNAQDLMENSYLSASPNLNVNNGDEGCEDMLASNITDNSNFQEPSPCNLEDAIITDEGFAIYDMGSEIVPEDRVSGYVVENGALNSQTDLYDVDSLTQDQVTPYNADDSIPSIEAAGVYVDDDQLEDYSVDSSVLASAQDTDICDGEAAKEIQGTPDSNNKNKILEQTLTSAEECDQNVSIRDKPVHKTSPFNVQLQEQTMSFAGSVSSFTQSPLYCVSNHPSPTLENKFNPTVLQEEKMDLVVPLAPVDVDVNADVKNQEESEENKSDGSYQWCPERSVSQMTIKEEPVALASPQLENNTIIASPLEEPASLIASTQQEHSSVLSASFQEHDTARASPQQSLVATQATSQQEIISEETSNGDIIDMVETIPTQGFIVAEPFPPEVSNVQASPSASLHVNTESTEKGGAQAPVAETNCESVSLKNNSKSPLADVVVADSATTVTDINILHATLEVNSLSPNTPEVSSNQSTVIEMNGSGETELVLGTGQEDLVQDARPPVAVTPAVASSAAELDAVPEGRPDATPAPHISLHPRLVCQDAQTSPLRPPTPATMDLEPRPALVSSPPPAPLLCSFDVCTQTPTADAPPDQGSAPNPTLEAILQILQQYRFEGREGALPLRALESLLQGESARVPPQPAPVSAASSPRRPRRGSLDDREADAADDDQASHRERAPRRRQRTSTATSHSVPRQRRRRRNSSGSEFSAAEAEAMAPARDASWPGETGVGGPAHRSRLANRRQGGRRPAPQSTPDYDSTDDAAVAAASTPRGPDDLGDCSDNFDASETFREMLRVDKEMQWLLAYKMKLYKRLCRGTVGHVGGGIDRPDMQVSSCSRPGDLGDEEDDRIRRRRRASEDSEPMLCQLAARAAAAGVTGSELSPPGGSYPLLDLGLGLGLGLGGGHVRPPAPPSDPVCPSPQTTTLTPARESFSGSPSSASPRAPGFRTPGEASVAADSEGGASVHGLPAAAGAFAPGLAGLGTEGLDPTAGESPASGHASKSPDCSDAALPSSLRCAVPAGCATPAPDAPTLASAQSPPMVRFPTDYCLSVCATSTLHGDSTRGSLESMLGLTDCHRDHGDADARAPSPDHDSVSVAAYDASVVEDVINSALKEQNEIHELHDGDTERLLADVELAAATAAAAARGRKLEESLRLTDTSVVEAVLSTFALPECELAPVLTPVQPPVPAILRTPPSESKAEPDSTGCDPPAAGESVDGGNGDDEDYEELDLLEKGHGVSQRGSFRRAGPQGPGRRGGRPSIFRVSLAARKAASDEQAEYDADLRLHHVGLAPTHVSTRENSPRGRRGRPRRRTGVIKRGNPVRASPSSSDLFDDAVPPALSRSMQTLVMHEEAVARVDMSMTPATTDVDNPRCSLQPDSTRLSPAGASGLGPSDAEAEAFLRAPVPVTTRGRRSRKHLTTVPVVPVPNPLVDPFVDPAQPEEMATATGAPGALDKATFAGRGRGRRRKAPSLASPLPPALPSPLAPTADEAMAPPTDLAADPSFSSAVRTRRRAREAPSLDPSDPNVLPASPEPAPGVVPVAVATCTPEIAPAPHLPPNSGPLNAAVTSSAPVHYNFLTTTTISGRRVSRKRKMDYAEIIEPKCDTRTDEERAMAPAPASVKAKRAKKLLSAKLKSDKGEKADKNDISKHEKAEKVAKHDKRKRVKESGRDRSPVVVVPQLLQPPSNSSALTQVAASLTETEVKGSAMAVEPSIDVELSPCGKPLALRLSTGRATPNEYGCREDTGEAFLRTKEVVNPPTRTKDLDTSCIKDCYIVLKPVDINQYLKPRQSEDTADEDEGEEMTPNLDESSQDYWDVDAIDPCLPATESMEPASPPCPPPPPPTDPTLEIESQLALLEEMSNHIAATRESETEEFPCPSVEAAHASPAHADGATTPTFGSDIAPQPLPLSFPPPTTCPSLKRPRLEAGSPATSGAATPGSSGGQTPPEDFDKDSVSSSDIGALDGGDSPNKQAPKRKPRKRKRKTDVGEHITFEAHRGPVLDVKTVGRHVLAACEDGSVYCYSLKSGKLKRQYCGHSAAVICLSILVREGIDGEDPVPEYLFTGSLDHHLRCFQFKSGTLVNQPVNLGKPIQCMDENWGTIFIGTKMGEVAKFYTKSFKLNEDYMRCSKDSILAIKATKEGARKVVIVAARNEPVTIRDANSGLLMRVVGHNLPHTVYSLLLEQSLLYCGTKTGKIPVFSFTSGEEVCRYSAGYGVVCMRIYNQLLFAGCYDGNIYIYSTQDKSLISCIPGPGKMLLCLDVVKNRIIAGSKDNKLQAWPLPAVVKNCIRESRHR